AEPEAAGGDAAAEAAREGPAGGGPAVQPGVRPEADQGGARDRAAPPVPVVESGGPAPALDAHGAGACRRGAGRPNARPSEPQLRKALTKGNGRPRLIVKKVYWKTSPPATPPPARRARPRHRWSAWPRRPATPNPALSLASVPRRFATVTCR